MAVVGAGAIGSYLALRAEQAGAAVAVCLRSRVDRIVVESGGRAHRLAAEMLDDPAAAGPVDWAILALKPNDVAAAQPWLDRLVGPATAVVVVQNGIEHTEHFDRPLDAEVVVPALAYANVERLGPGRFRHRAGDRLIVPAGPGADALAELFAASDLVVDGEPDFLTAAWRKLLANVAINPITALTTGRLRILQDDARVRDLAADLMREAVRVGAAEGAAVDDGDVDAMLGVLADYPGEGGTSMLFDRLAARPLEHESLTGAVVRAADRHGIPVALNDAVLTLLQGLDRTLREARPDEGETDGN